MGKFFNHLHTINKHRRLVRKVCFKIGIPFQGLVHDLSKYSYTEFHNSTKYYTDGSYSPTENERRTKGYSEAWMHHRGRNKHHMEYWFDVDVATHKYVPLKMPIKYLKEMFADRIAASKVYNKDHYTDSYPLDYLLTHMAEFMMHKESFNEMKKWLEYLKDHGEKETFKYVKSLKSY